MDLNRLVTQVLNYEDPDTLDATLGSLPLEQLYSEAEAMSSAGSDWSEEDCLVIALLRWFKGWFKWVNAPPCDSCGGTDMESPQAGDPTPDDLRYGARNVEVWSCKTCGGKGRFPRYNDTLKLLETRSGRCGEWAHVMHQILRSLGRTTRYIWNSEDHVWNEIWSEKANRWIHIDSCEAAFDKPLTYTVGWGKKMAYVLAFSVGGARDVSIRYIRPRNMQLPRKLFNETELEVVLAAATRSLRADMDPVDLVEWFEHDSAETEELKVLQSESEAEIAREKEKKGDEYLPRQSGSSEWVKSRHEDGN